MTLFLGNNHTKHQPQKTTVANQKKSHQEKTNIKKKKTPLFYKTKFWIKKSVK